MKRSKFKVETFVFSVVMAACMIMPHSMSGQSGRADGFFSSGSESYENRDGGAEVSGGITNDSFNAPLGSGLLTLASAGIAYALLKRRRRRSRVGVAALVAMTLLLGLSQCKKKTCDVIPYDNKAVNITLNTDAGARSDVNPGNGTVTFVDGDEILVANNGCYVGRLVFDDGVFTGTITNPKTTDYLHFFHLGNKDFGTLTEGSSQSCSVSISDQITGLPVISSGCSTEMYSTEVTNYTARLYNRCALVQFNVDNYSESAATCVSGFKNKVSVNFLTDAITFSQQDGGKIYLPSGNGYKWAVLLPQAGMAAGSDGSAFSGRYQGRCGAVPEIVANEVYDNAVEVVVHTPRELTGSLSALFSINEQGKQVCFSQANLEYIKASGEWRFFDNQYDTFERDSYGVGTDYTYRTTATLLGWGTSGFDHGSVYHMPINTSTSISGYYAYSDPSKNLFDGDGRADWGYNKIANGGMAYKQWRMLTHDEWCYILKGREDAEDKFAEAIINVDASTAKKGFVLLPDDWTEPYADCFTPGIGDAFQTNVYSLEQWHQMEAAGAVYLPTAGRRFKESCSGAQKYMFLWTSTVYDAKNAYSIFVKPTEYDQDRIIEKCYGCSVRLVCD